MSVEFYSVKLRKSVSMSEEKCVKRAFDFTTKKNNKTCKRYMVSCVDGELKLSKFLSADAYSVLNCKEEQK